jgi:hypothetical protein
MLFHQIKQKICPAANSLVHAISFIVYDHFEKHLEKLIAHTSPHKSKNSMFSEKLNEFCNKMTMNFSAFGQFVYHDKSVPFTGTYKYCFTMTISAIVTVLK